MAATAVDSERCAHITTLNELMAALKDPSQPLVIDLGGRSFTPTGAAVRPRGGPMMLKRSKSDNCPALPNDHAGPDSERSGRLACHSDSRYAGEWRMDEEDSFSSSSAASVNAESSPSIDSADGAHATLGQQRTANRRSSRIALQAPQGRSRRFRRRTQQEHNSSAAATNIAFQPAASGGPDSWRSQSSAEAHVSEDTGDDAHVAATTDLLEQVNELRTVDAAAPIIAADAGDAAHHGMVAGQWPENAVDDALAAAPAHDGGEPVDEWHVMHGGHVLPPDNANLDEYDCGYREEVPTTLYLDIVRPGTVICNGSIEVPESMMVRVLASCTLKNLSLRGPGVPADEYWGYLYPALVSVGWPDSPRIHVEAHNVKIKRVGHSNGFKVHGPADVHMTQCLISNCRRNGLIVHGPDARVSLKHCTMANNEASGLWVVSGGTVTAESCNFQDNKCNGAAAWDLRSSIAARACTFRRNIANGLRLLYGASGSLLACSVAFNQDQGVEAGEAATRLRIEDSTITCNNNFALKSYQRAGVFMKNTVINRGQPRASSIHAQGNETHVQTNDCMIDGQSTFMTHAVHTQYPRPQQA